MTQARGKGGSHSGRSKFIDGAARRICHKQIARAVKGQTTLDSQARRKGGSHSSRSKFIDGAAPASATNRLPALSKARPAWIIQSRRKRASHSVWSELIDVAVVEVLDIYRKQILRRRARADQTDYC